MCVSGCDPPFGRTRHVDSAAEELAGAIGSGLGGRTPDEVRRLVAAGDLRFSAGGSTSHDGIDAAHCREGPPGDDLSVGNALESPAPPPSRLERLFSAVRTSGASDPAAAPGSPPLLLPLAHHPRSCPWLTTPAAAPGSLPPLLPLAHYPRCSRPRTVGRALSVSPLSISSVRVTRRDRSAWRQASCTRASRPLPRATSSRLSRPPRPLTPRVRQTRSASSSLIQTTTCHRGRRSPHKPSWTLPGASHHRRRRLKSRERPSTRRPWDRPVCGLYEGGCGVRRAATGRWVWHLV